MELIWRWTTLVIFMLISHLSLTQNLDSKWSNLYKTQQSFSENANSNHNFRILENIDLEQADTKSNININIKNNHEESVDEQEPVNEHDSNKPHSRQKRLIWITDDGRLALPPGTTLSISPTIALPFVRYPPSGFLSNMTVSLPLTIDFDKLGLTDNQNPLGVIPDYFGRSMGRAAGSFLGQYVSQYLHSRKKRELKSDFYTVTSDEIHPPLPEEHQHAFHGGERAILYTIVEDFLTNFGLNGKACLLRAICEVHSKPVHQLGLIGEMLRLFFTASKSPYSDLLDEYVSAEKIGAGTHGPGECYPYFKDCPRSLFQSNKNRYMKDEKHGDFSTNNINPEPIVM